MNQNNPVMENINKNKFEKINFIILGINYLICSIMMLLMTFDTVSSELSNSYTVGWFIIFAPIIIAIYVAAYIPDVLCLLFSYIASKTKKNIFIILTIICSAIGILIINLDIIKDSLRGSLLSVLFYVYIVFKIIIIVYNIILLTQNNKKTN